MTIFRVQHEKNYTVVNNFIITDNTLSWKAKGIWLYAFSRPDDWTFYVADLIKQSTDKDQSVQTGLKELEDRGYLVKKVSKNEKGQFTSEYTFYETPQIKEKFPESISRHGFSVTENPPLLSTDKVSIDKPIKTPPNPLKGACGRVSSSLNKKRYGESCHVELTDDEYAKLLQKIPQDELTEWITDLDIEAGKVGVIAFNKKYKSHYHTILSWRRRRLQNTAQERHRSSVGAYRGERVDRRTRDENGVPDEAPHLKGLF